MIYHDVINHSDMLLYRFYLLNMNYFVEIYNGRVHNVAIVF